MKRIIIDADTGVDDSLAILYALRSPNFRVEGITTCFGNNNAEQSADNSLRLIKLSGCGYEVPVAVGANESLEGVFESAPAFIHGDNGIGNVELPKSTQKPLEEPACDFIIRKAEELKGELIIITTGRMTNLALAFQKARHAFINRSGAQYFRVTKFDQHGAFCVFCVVTGQGYWAHLISATACWTHDVLRLETNVAAHYTDNARLFLS